MAFIYILVGLLGLSLGSFMSVLVFRLDTKKGIISGRSECARCLTKLKWRDLIPLLSFLTIKGKCRYCKNKISRLYPIMELAAAGSFVLYFWAHPSFGPETLYGLAMIFIFLTLTFFDYLYYILPDKVILTGFGISVLYSVIIRQEFFVNSLLTGFGLAAFFAIIYIVSRGEWIGFGDVKLVFLIGLTLGYPLVFFTVVSAVWVAALWGIGLIMFKKATLKTALPFGSFLSAAAVLSIVFKNAIEEQINNFQYFL